ncbi:DNA primase [Poseidonocella sedimentorum]|uniref:DNA primase n=1 Tax=Poseidonocella sedimentorum TaxID=871652 RepID=A0A1I6CQU4_9RHOB|nr:DNA primase [Poseidonocella sedimentorum]SFQ95503.1 DNA primase [Poseidonocella sedimentorum]
MSLPPGFIDELRNRLSMTQVVGRKVMWDTRKSNQAKGDMWAPCPFHQEKTASFHVDDRKGFYNCFGCGAKGDVFKFVQETENASFMEAVEILAREAGMQMPARDPKAQEKADRATQLADVMEEAVKFFRLQLRTGAASAARAYLDKRGMAAETQGTFEIGYAPAGWQGLFDHLTAKGIAPQMMLDAGLVREGKQGNRPYDVFRDRIIFPIRDPRGRCIAFGGRAMDPDDNAKYLNSPATQLFDKSRTLYNHGPARAAAGRGAPLIVAEGYMDVIALSEAGFEGAVAPLGTAVTPQHLDLLWRIAPEPIIALDGDTAGLRAAYKVIDIALPLLAAGRALRFALMPDGMDPDDLIRAKGPEAVQGALDAAAPLLSLLWRRETEGRVFDSPERKAALDKSLRQAVSAIQDPVLKGHYEREVKDLLWQLFRKRPERGASMNRPGGQKRGGAFKTQPIAPRATTRASLLARGDEGAQDRLRETVILATLIATPQVIEEFEDRLERLRFSEPSLARTRDAILRAANAGAGQGAEAFRETLMQNLGAEALENLLTADHVAIVPAVRHPGNAEFARLTLEEELTKLDAHRGLAAEIAEACEDLSGAADESVTWRLGQASAAVLSATRSQQGDSTEHDIADNGLPIRRDERGKLDDLLARISQGRSGPTGEK